MDRSVMNSLLASPDIHAIRALHDKWIDAELRGDIAAVLELCTDDVRWMVPNGAPVAGKAAAASCKVISSLGSRPARNSSSSVGFTGPPPH